MDTADFNAEGVSPQIIDSYDGGIILLEIQVITWTQLIFQTSRIMLVRHLLRQMGLLFLELMISLVLLNYGKHLKAHPEIKHCEFV